MFHWKKAVVIATAAVLALTGCAAGSEADPADRSGGTLTLGLITPVSSFSAQGANWANQSPYMQAVYDSLLRASPDGTIQPNLATEWSYNEDNTVLSLTLRDDVKFTDGTPFNADAAAQNLLRFRDGTSPNASFLVNLADATAIDDTHVELTLTAPDPALLTYLTQNAGLQESPAAFENADVETVPVGSGPYTLNVDETVVGSSYVFDQNPDYWNPDDQHYDKVVMNYYADNTSLLNAIQGGQLNASTTIDNTSLDQITAAGYTLSPIENNWWGLILADRDGTLNPALGDPKVRQAINYAFDRDAMLQAFTAGQGTVTEQVFPTSSTSFDPALDETYSYDPEKAKELLAEAGYGDGFDLVMPTAAAFGPSNFALIQQQLADVGVRVTFEELQVNDYITAIVGGKYAVALMGLQLDPTDWQLSQFEIDKNAPWNPFHTDDPTVQDYIAELQTGTEEDAEAAGKALNEYIVDQAWFAPWFRPALNFVSDSNTELTVQVGNSYPYLWNIKPKN
ncbi:peptide/nickel transport system substrate-binding protein [Microbacterium sp. cf046]|uniref:ABC transporter substrate-binding protein n=1 Tax=Microbacterium sp. cf046 TaxID=1761803 RepID=UPI0008EFE157|nr:ABC transporter substrate-binding protein [Microbacterium sp. cf046]SFS16867.1 peptide/nickel transport system substrate-binding protein [Microbacterium sp. cf046]